MVPTSLTIAWVIYNCESLHRKQSEKIKSISSPIDCGTDEDSVYAKTSLCF